MRIAYGDTARKIYFVAVDATDLKTRETGLSSFTVVRSRDGAADVTYTTPTVTEIDASTMPGVYALTVDEDVAALSNVDEEEVCLHITHAGMAPVTRVFELFRPKATAGETIAVASGVASANAVQIEGADPSDTIRDAVVDDATRIDASALNTLSGHDPGETIMGATDLGTGTGFTAIPWNASWDAEVQSEVADALAVYDPPTKAELDAAVAPLALEATAQDILADTAEIATVDGNVDAIKAKTDLIPGTADGHTWAERELLVSAAALGKSDGFGTPTVHYRALDDSKDRITATVNAGNRTAVTLDPA